MAAKIPVSFRQKTKLPPAINGNGYPYQLSATDLDKNFDYLLNLIPQGANKNDLLYWDGQAWAILTCPSGSGTFVLGSVDGTLQWLATEACA